MIRMMTLWTGLAFAPRQIKWNMPPSLFWMIWIGILALFVLMLSSKSRQIARRRAMMEQLGMEIGFAFFAQPDETLYNRLAGMQDPFTMRSGSHAFKNVLVGRAGGGEAVIADRSTGSGDSRNTATIIAYNYETALPSFAVYPETGLFRVVEKLGFADIDIDSAPEFSKRFFLHGKNEAETRALFKPEVTRAFEALDPKSRLYITASGSWLVASRGRFLPVEKLRGFLQETEPLANAIRRARSVGVFS
jgi:hypothetical protein